MPGSKRVATGIKMRPAVEPLARKDRETPDQLQAIVLACLAEITKQPGGPWPGDRLSIGLMVSLLSLFETVLEDTGYYNGQAASPPPPPTPSPRKVRRIIRQP